MRSSEPSSSRKRSNALAKRRRLILEAAVTCFLTNGYHQTGVREIAQQAGVSLGNLYNHFPSKDAVLLEIAQLEREELAPLVSLLEKSGAAPRILERFIDRYGRYLSQPENVILSIEISSEAIRNEAVSRVFLANRDTLIRALRRLLDRGLEEGVFQAPMDTHTTAHMIVDVIEGGAYRKVLTKVSMRDVLRGLKAFITSAVETGSQR